jgi:hypothetical protein
VRFGLVGHKQDIIVMVKIVVVSDLMSDLLSDGRGENSVAVSDGIDLQGNASALAKCREIGDMTGSDRACCCK